MKTRVASLSELVEGRGKVVELEGGRAIALFRQGDSVHALDNACPHVQGPLGEGRVVEGRVVCPWHNWQFELTTGCWERDRAIKVACYAVEVEGDDVHVDL